MPLARSYSSTPQAQSADVGPSPFEQLGPALNNLAIDPQLKVFRYTVLPVIKSLPVVGQVTQLLEWASHPKEELMKAVDISPSVGGAIKESIISNAVGSVAKVLAVSSGLAAGGQLSSDLVQRAIACEAATTAQRASRNSTKFVIQEAWNGFVKGGWFFDKAIYDEKYLFHYDADGRAARWQANSVARRFGLEGEDLKFGSHYFSKIYVDRNSPLVPFAKAGKIGWQVLGPTLATAAVFPAVAPLVFAWQALNADWGQFVAKHSYGVSPDPNLSDGRSKDYNGDWVLHSSGKGYRWWEINELTDPGQRFKNKFFKTLDDFFTIRGLYRTFITGDTLWERGWKKRGQYNDWPIRFGYGKNDIYGSYKNISFYDPRQGDYVRHFNKKKRRNELRLPNGQVVQNLFRNGRVVEITGTNRFFQGAYRVQQVTAKIAAPVALTAVLAFNPATAVLAPVAAVAAAFSVAKNLGEVLEPLKWFGWKTGIYNQMQFIQRYASKYGKIANLAHPLVFVLEENGSTFFRRWARRFYSVFSPFDRDVGVLAGVVAWRDLQWEAAAKAFKNSAFGKAIRDSIAGALIKYPALRKLFRFLKGAPIISPVAKFVGGTLLGGAKWILAPGQAVKDAIWNFAKWVAWKGFRFAFGHAIRKWIMRPLTRLLLGWAKNLPAGSIRGKIIRWLLGKTFGAFRPSAPAKSFLNKLLGGPLRKIFSQIARQIFNLIIRLLKWIFQQVIMRLVQWVVKTAADIVIKIAATIGAPVWIAVGIAVAIFLLLLMVALLLIFLVMMFLSSMAAPSPYQSGPESSYLAIRKEVGNPKPSSALFVAGDTIEYTIKYKVKKKVIGAIVFEDKFLYASLEGGKSKNLFDPDSLNCESPVDITSNSLAADPAGPPGYWKSLIGSVPNPGDSTDWQEVKCSAKVADGYTEGTLINHAVIKAQAETDKKEVSVSQFLYVNGGSASGWPTEHGCFTQGPRTQGVFSSHKNQEAVDIGKNDKIGFPVDGEPIYSTIAGKVLRVCYAGSYLQSTRAGVCGGIDEGSQFGPGFGTYIIIKETNTPLSLFYAHLGSVSISEGSSIAKGGIIGFVDNTGKSTGPHLHYAFTKNSGASMNQPFIPYYVPTCSGEFPDPSCESAFKNIGEPDRVCF